jgi:hypothetical protein
MSGHPIHTQDNIHAFQIYGNKMCRNDLIPNPKSTPRIKVLEEICPPGVTIL